MKSLLAQVVEGQGLSVEQAEQAFEWIMTGRATPAQAGALLALLASRGPSVEELTGAATVMRAKASPVAVPGGLTVIDTCGTGGDHAGTFNISTAAALVAAAAGLPRGVVVAKHGNKSVTSNSGSSQVLQALGVKLQVPGDTLTRCLGEAGICFCFAPVHHPAMKFAGPIRAELGLATIFNLVGPLTNPAGATRQVMGVYAPRLVPLLAGALQRLGTVHAMVVHGQVPGEDGHTTGGLDELSTAGGSRVAEVSPAGRRQYDLDPTDVGLSYSHPSSLRVDTPARSASVIREVLAGRPGPARDIVALNAAAALVVADLAADLAQGLSLALETIDSGAPRRTLDKLIEMTRQASSE